jgi:integrase
MRVSIERIERSSGVVWRVRWRDQAGRERSRVIGRKRDAEAFDADLRRRKRTGELNMVDAGKQTLAEFVEEWWLLYAAPNLAPATLELYAMLWDKHVLPRLGDCQLRELTPERIEAFRGDLVATGAGQVSIRKALVLLQGVLQRAVEWRRIPYNPARLVRKPPAGRRRQVRPLPPATIEQMRARLLGSGRRRDAVLLSTLAYAGLRPGEALALTWSHVRERTLLIEQAVSHGEIKATKTGQTRTVRLLGPLASELAAWRLECRGWTSEALVFSAYDGGAWSRDDWGNWRNRVFRPAARAAGVEKARPYDLRHSFCSLLIYEGATVVEVARQLGHSPLMTLNTYGHVFDELQGTERLSAEEQIRSARAEHVSVVCPRTATDARRNEGEPAKVLQIRSGRCRSRTSDLLLVRQALSQLS